LDEIIPISSKTGLNLARIGKDLLTCGGAILGRIAGEFSMTIACKLPPKPRDQNPIGKFIDQRQPRCDPVPQRLSDYCRHRCGVKRLVPAVERNADIRSRRFVALQEGVYEKHA
jgi:hypothetical protein